MLDLETLGPSGLVDELGRQLLTEEKRPRSGSLRIWSSPRKEKSSEDTANLRLCLVFDPARGGAFVRALNSKEFGGTRIMTESVNATPVVVDPKLDAGESGLREQLSGDLAAVKSLLAVQTEREALANEAEEARKVRAQMCAYLLESGLAAARLPAAMAEHVRKQFDGRIFDAAELNQAIDDARALVSSLVGGSIVQGPRVSGMFSTDDRCKPRWMTCWGAADKGKETLKVQT
jgi:hypothetical protein